MYLHSGIWSFESSSIQIKCCDGVWNLFTEKNKDQNHRQKSTRKYKNNKNKSRKRNREKCLTQYRGGVVLQLLNKVCQGYTRRFVLGGCGCRSRGGHSWSWTTPSSLSSIIWKRETIFIGGSYKQHIKTNLILKLLGQTLTVKHYKEYPPPHIIGLERILHAPRVSYRCFEEA